MGGSVFRLDSVSVASDYTLRLSDFTLEIRAGEIMGVMGASNSGKTSLCHVLAGKEKCSGGTIFYRGRPVREDRVPKEIAERVALIDNSSSLAPSLKVSELLALVNPERGRWLFVNRAQIYSEAEWVLKALSIELDPDVRAMELTAAQRHLVLIAEAFLQGAELIALNNTVGGYTDQEWEAIKRTLHVIMEKGIAVLLTSSQENRLIAACDHITVLAHGTNLKIFEPEHYGLLQTVLAGLRGTETVPAAKAEPDGRAVFRAERLHTKSLRAGGFELRRGEIVGFYDPDNMTGQELFAALMEMDPEMGHYELDGTPLAGLDPVRCMKRGIGFIPDGAVEKDLFLQLSVMDNILCSSRRKLGGSFLFRRKAMDHLASTYASVIGIGKEDMLRRVESFDSLGRLRIYLCRWALVRVRLLFCHSLFENVDLDAREELKHFLQATAAKGAAVGLFGYDRNSLLEVCDSIYIIEGDRIGPRLEREKAKRLLG